MNLTEKYKQYGFINFLKRLFFWSLSILGIRIDSWLVCTQYINVASQKTKSISSEFNVKALSYLDFVNSNKFGSNKLMSFKSRFDKKTFHAYGVFDDKHELAYYCWISFIEFQFSKNLYQMSLNDTQGLLFDAFCFPNFRGKRLHSFMNCYRLKKLKEFGKTEAVVILLSQNIPARKSQKRAYFTCSRTITTYSFFGKKGYYTSNKKINL
jgi:hypothetical protein